MTSKQAKRAAPVIFENGTAGYKSSMTVKCGNGYYVGQAHAEIALVDEDSSPLVLTLEVPAHATAQAVSDSKTLQLSEAGPALGLSSIDSISTHVERILSAALILHRLRITSQESQPAFQFRVFVNVSCLTLNANPLDMALLCALSTLLLLHFPTLSFDTERKWWRQELDQMPAFTGTECFDKFPLTITCTEDSLSGEYYIDNGFGEGPARALAAMCHHYDPSTLAHLNCRSLIRLPSPSSVATRSMFASELARVAAITQRSADDRMQALIKAHQSASK